MLKRTILFVFLSFSISFSAFCANLINDTETENLLYEIISPLAKSANIPENRLQIHIINEDSFNAFVRGGDDIYIYTGLLKQIKNPNALQGVIAHELGHTIGGHMAQMSARMDAELKRTLLVQALGIGLMVAGGNPSLGAGVLAGSSGITQQSMLSFSRDEERIADDMAIDLMINAKVNPNGLIDVFEQMQIMTGAIESKINPNKINHPLTTERLNNVKEKISATQNKQIFSKTPKNISERYEIMRAKLIGYLDTFEKTNTKYPKSDKSDAAIYARAIANMNKGNLSTALTGTKTLISRNSNNPYYHELLGDIKYQLGDYDASISAYEKSLSLLPNSPQIQTALALVLNERNKANDKEYATELCKKSILSKPAPLTYWVLAHIFTDGRSDWAMAEFYSLNGDIKNAKKFAKKAKSKLDKASPEYIKSQDILNL
ncbi:MAG: M48 family metalloprotease [Alphaproteobacteria bacterium]